MSHDRRDAYVDHVIVGGTAVNLATGQAGALVMKVAKH